MAAGTHTIAFVGQAPNTGDSTAFLDAVSLVGLATATPSGASAVRWTVYDGPTPLLDFDGSGTLTARYLSVPGAIDELLARQTASGVAWYLDDRQGSVKDLINNSGTTIDHVDYSAYGQATDSVPTQGDRIKYAGMEFDAAIGLYYDRARYFDAMSGKFVNLDPSGFAAGDANLFRYAGNDASNLFDVTGLQIAGPPVAAPIGIGVGAGGTAVGVGAGGTAVGVGVGTVAIGVGVGVGIGIGVAVGTYITGPILEPILAPIFYPIFDPGPAPLTNGPKPDPSPNPQPDPTPKPNPEPAPKPKPGGNGGCDNRNPAQDNILSKGEIKRLEDAGHDVHDLKGGKNASKYDLYKDRCGNIYVKPKGGRGPGEPINVNINDL